ncbi:MAG: hypothetical protein QMD07_05030 [Thermodesulfovibrionales bacterium]|nr:hypothetical protein [Thermodesulfovibrionales bacterium]
MKIRIFIVLLILFTAGMASAQDATPSQVDARFQTANQWLKQNNLSITTSPD